MSAPGVDVSHRQPRVDQDAYRSAVVVTEPDLVAEVRAMRDGHGDPVRMLTAFRAAVIYGQRPRGPSLASIVVGVHDTLASAWVCVYSSLAEFERATGGGEWWSTTGADVLDNILPALPRVAGVVLDLWSDHQMAFPVVPPISRASPGSREPRDARSSDRVARCETGSTAAGRPTAPTHMAPAGWGR